MIKYLYIIVSDFSVQMMLAALVDEPLNTGDILHKGSTVRLVQYYNT